MPESSGRVNGWRQESLIPAENVRIRCEVVISELGNVSTWHVRAVDESDQTLIAAWTLPMRRWDSFDDDMTVALQEFVELIRHHTKPF